MAETGAYRIQRVWLDGPKAGSAEVFIDNLPGFPDNINLTDRGAGWVALPGVRIAVLDDTAGSPFLRKLRMRLPRSIHPAPARYGMTVELDAEGRPTSGGQLGFQFLEPVDNHLDCLGRFDGDGPSPDREEPPAVRVNVKGATDSPIVVLRNSVVQVQGQDVRPFT